MVDRGGNVQKGGIGIEIGRDFDWVAVSALNGGSFARSERAVCVVPRIHLMQEH
jgi:hypothetical protein